MADIVHVERRDLVALLYWIDRLPPLRARWEAEAIVVRILTGRVANDDEPPAPSESGVFPIS